MKKVMEVSHGWEQLDKNNLLWGFSVTVKVPQIQFIAESEDILVVQQRRGTHSSNCASFNRGVSMAVGAAMRVFFWRSDAFFALLLSRGAPWNRSSTTRSSFRRLMFLCRRWRTNWWRCVGSSMFAFPSRVSKCPRSHLHPVIAGAVCASRSRRQNSWLKCRRPYPILLYCSGLWSRTLTFQFLVMEGDLLAFKVFFPDRVQQRRLLRRSLTILLLVEVFKVFAQDRVHLHHSHLQLVFMNTQMSVGKGFFGLFPGLKRARSPPPVRVRGCPLGRALDSGGLCGGAGQGRVRRVLRVPRRLVEAGLGLTSTSATVGAKSAVTMAIASCRCTGSHCLSDLEPPRCMVMAL